MRYGAVIAAAGASNHIERFRQFSNISQVSIAERVIVNFHRAGVKDIVMVTGNNAELLEKALRDFDIKFIRNPDYEKTDMFESAKIGFRCLGEKCDRLLFCPAVVPFFADETIRTQMERMDEDEACKVVIPTCGGQDGHPLLIDAAAIPGILEYKGKGGLRAAIGKLPEQSVQRISVDDEGAVIYPRTKEELRKVVDTHNDRLLHPKIKVSFVSTTPFFGPGTVGLLKEIEKCGNVRDACEKCGFSYSKGWSIIRACEDKYGYSIVERQAGGQNGGTARVTEKGYELLAVYEELEKEINELAEKKFRKLMKEHHLAGEA